jgi:drug/metabolite transporter (DMT)-like permease
LRLIGIRLSFPLGHVAGVKSIAAIVYITLVPMALGNLVWFYFMRVLPANFAALTKPGQAGNTGA